MTDTSDKWQLDEPIDLQIEHTHQYVHSHNIPGVGPAPAVHLHGGSPGIRHTHSMEVSITSNGYEIRHPLMNDD